MSEAWHQHLQNLTWWEQIDRFFNPDKYSCTTHYSIGSWATWVLLVLLLAIFVFACCYFAVAITRKKPVEKEPKQ